MPSVSKPKVYLVGTGGTISSIGADRMDYINYSYMGNKLAIEQMLARVPEVLEIADVRAEQFLNFGSPERPDIYYQLEQCIRGIAEACRVLEVPVVSGNVSLYNESRGQAIFPTPIIGGLGLLEDSRNVTRSAFVEDGLMVVLLGADTSETRSHDLAGSEYLQWIHGRVEGSPKIDIELEKRVQSACREAIQKDLINSAHDCSEGGLAVALA